MRLMVKRASEGYELVRVVDAVVRVAGDVG